MNQIPRALRIGVGVVALAGMFGLGWIVAKAGVGQAMPLESLTELERTFAERMQEVVLVGNFTIAGRETRGGSPERYEISSVSKVGDDRWRFDVRMVYGSVDATLPVVVPIVWAGMGSNPALWKMVLDEGRRSNWPEIARYGVDEPGDAERNQSVRKEMKGINAFRAKYPEYGLRMTTALGSSRGIQTVGHYFDIWIGCMAQRTGESGMIDQAKMHGKELWTYDCMAAPVDAETDRYYFGVWAWVSGVKGCSHWAYFCQPHLSYVFPTEEELVPSIGWEAIREGIDDYRYLKTLEQLADQARAAGRAELVSEADKIFADVEGMVTMDNYGKAYHVASASEVPRANAWERPRVEPDLPIEIYDQMRLKVAREIQKLSEALGPQ